MKKTRILILFSLMSASAALSQSVRQNDRWGQALYFLDGNVLKTKDQWGTPVYYFECIPEKWIITSIIL